MKQSNFLSAPPPAQFRVETNSDPSLTAVLVILTGIFGALTVTPFMNKMRINDYAARGFAVGLTSHGIGTARAYEVNATAGLFAGIAMALNAVATSILASFAARYLIP